MMHGGNGHHTLSRWACYRSRRRVNQLVAQPGTQQRGVRDDDYSRGSIDAQAFRLYV